MEARRGARGMDGHGRGIGLLTMRRTSRMRWICPWAELALPLEGAKVTFSDTETVSVHHTGSDAAALAARYGASLGAAGWKLEHDGSAGGIVSQTWNKGDDSMSLTMQPKDDLLVVSLAVLAF